MSAEVLSLSRRSFFGGVLAVTGAAMLPGRAWASIPKIYADGFHDDTAGFQAALRGEPFLVAREGLAINRGGTLYLTHGSFRLSQTIVPTTRVPVVSANNHYDFSGARHELECCLDITNADGSQFLNDHFDQGGMTKYGILDRSFLGNGGHISSHLRGRYVMQANPARP